jgi:selenocysteine lyase/cysteine desulfurase
VVESGLLDVESIRWGFPYSMRASTCLYNTPGEIKKLLGAVEDISKG